MSEENPPKLSEAFIEARKATQFKPGHTPAHKIDGGTGANAPYSIRRQLQAVACAEIDHTRLDEELNALRTQGGRKNKIARLTAVRAFEKLLKKMPEKMLDSVINQMEGNLVQKKQEIPPAEKMPEEFISEEDAAAAHLHFGK